jgi:hypothetical protein
MYARKLGRLAGLVFVLAAILGGTSSAAQAAQHHPTVQAAELGNASVDWH